MKKSIIRTSTFAFMLGAIMAATAQPTDIRTLPAGHQPLQSHTTQAPLSECERINHQNFCYCTGACDHAA
jgi:hypothetical protein